MAGLLGEDWDDPKTQMNLMLAAGLLGGRGNFAQVLGGALGPAMQARNQAQSAMGQRQQQEMQRKLMEAQIAETLAQAEQRRRTPPVKNLIPVGRNLYDVDARQWIESPAGPDPSDPASIREWGVFSKMTPEQQERFLTMKRADVQVVDIGGVPTLVKKQMPSGQRSPTAAPVPLSTLPAEVGAAAAKADAVEGAKTRSELLAKDATVAQTTLPKVEADVAYSISLLDKAKSHPGLLLGVGDIIRGNLPPIYGDQAAFITLHKQLLGQQFMRAYETLRGANNITNIEGEKGTEALARLGRVQTAEDFKEAASELQQILRTGLERQRAKVRRGSSPSGSPATPTTQRVRTYNLETDSFE